jgi:hypothetical protein
MTREGDEALMAKRPRSTRYVARSNPQRYLLSGIPPTLWQNCRAAAKHEHVSMRTLILGLLEGWLLARDPRTWMEKAERLARQANPLPPEPQRRRSAQPRERQVADEGLQQPEDEHQHHHHPQHGLDRR